MNNHDFSKIVIARQEQCKEVLLQKAEEYAGETDRLENFKRAAALQGITPAEALMGMMAKHWVSIAAMIEKLQIGFNFDEMWAEKITDSINYLHLLEAVLNDMFRDLGKPAVASPQLPEVD